MSAVEDSAAVVEVSTKADSAAVVEDLTRVALVEALVRAFLPRCTQQPVPNVAHPVKFPSNQTDASQSCAATASRKTVTLLALNAVNAHPLATHVHLVEKAVASLPSNSRF